MWGPISCSKMSMSRFGAWSWSRASPAPGNHHTMHYLFIVNEPGTLRADYDDGTSKEQEYELGQVVMGQKDSVHRVTNVGSARYSNAIIELKQ